MLIFIDTQDVGATLAVARYIDTRLSASNTYLKTNEEGIWSFSF